MDHDAIRHAVAVHALDATDPDERARVDQQLVQHLPGCDDCLRMMRDLREVGGDLALAAGATAVSPSLEGRILETIRNEQPIVLRQRRRPAATRALAAAAAVALVASVGWNAVLVGRAGRAERRASALSAAVQLASNPETRSVSLRGRSGEMVLLYRPGGKATLIATNIEAPPAGKLLELWLIKDGKPTPVIAFRPQQGSVLVSVPIDPSAFRGVAVTVEDRFVQRPTTEPIYAGTIQA
ncbi:MAG: anti-sigma factor domain-containing protein [Actinomycetota bacterium]